MSKVVVINNLTLDGVMQAPGRLDENTRVLLIHRLVLGSGRRLFRDGGPFAALRLADAVTAATGVVIATYQSAGRRRRRVPRAEAGLVSVRSRRRRAR